MKVYLVWKVYDNCEYYEDRYTYNSVERIFMSKEKAIEYINKTINGLKNDDIVTEDKRGKVTYMTDTTEMESEDARRAKDAIRLHENCCDYYIFAYEKGSYYENVIYYGYYVDERETEV